MQTTVNPRRKLLFWRVEREFPGCPPEILASYPTVHPIVEAEANEPCIVVVGEYSVSMGLDAVSSLIWLFCDGQHSVEDIAKYVADTYEIDPQEARTDVIAAIGFLISMNLMEGDDAFIANCPDLVVKKQIMLPGGCKSADSPLRSPTQINWDINRDCNCRCRYCYVSADSNPSEPPIELDRAKYLADMYADSGVWEVFISGGEPLLHPNFWEILEYTRNKGITVSLVSNGHLMDAEAAARLKEVGINKVQISLDSADPDIHDDLRQSLGSHEKALKAVKHLLEAGIFATTSTTVTKANYAGAADCIKLAMSIGSRGHTLRRAFTVGRARTEISSLAIEAKELAEMAEQLYNRQSEWQGKIRVTANDPLVGFASGSAIGDSGGADFAHTGCRAARSEVYVTQNGDLYPCPFLPIPIGNLFQDSLIDLWNSAHLQQVREETAIVTESCMNCNLLPLCVDQCKGFTYSAFNTFDHRDPVCLRDVEQRIPQLVKEALNMTGAVRRFATDTK